MEQVAIGDARVRPRFGMVYAADLTSPEVQALRPLAFRVWIILTTYTDRGGTWAVSLLRMADDAGLGGSPATRKKSIRAALDELVEAQLVHRTAGPNPAGTGQGWNRYELRTPPSVLARESCQQGGGESPPRGGGESPPPYQTKVHSKNKTNDGSPPTPPPGGLRHDRRREARLQGLDERCDEMAKEAENRLFDEARTWDRAVRDGSMTREERDQIVSQLRIRLFDEIGEYRSGALVEIDREWSEADRRRAPRRAS